MPARRLPVHPDLEQLRHQAKDLLRAFRRGDAHALADLREFHPTPPPPEQAKLADAQLALARSYQASSWPRLVLSCRLIDAIWENDVDGVRALVLAHPQLLTENAGIANSNWGPPLSYAANLGRDEIIAMLHALGATDLQHAIDRAVLQSRIGTAQLLHRMMGAPKPPAGAFGGSAYTLSVSGTEFLFAIGAELVDEQGRPDAPVDVVLETDSRRRADKHRILELYAEHGFALPDTPMMAVHRGRIDLLEPHVRRDPSLLERTFTYAEIFPPELECHAPDPVTGDEHLPRTLLAGSTLLHVCVEYEEIEIAEWLLKRGMRADARAAVDPRGFGGHTALFNAVVSYPNFWINFTRGWAHSQKPESDAFTRLLLDHGADPNARASLREVVFPERGADRGTSVREHRDITPLQWGESFHDRLLVNAAAVRLLADRGGAT